MSKPAPATNRLSDDPDAQARYLHYQDERIGDPRAHGWRDWPTLDGRAIPRKRAIRGWRMWGVVDIGTAGSRLVAPYRPEWDYEPARWYAGVNTSGPEVCRARVTEHPSPEDHCRCGFRMVQSLTVLSAFIRDQAERFGTHLAVGEVEAWGRIAPAAPDDDWQYTARAQRMRALGPLYLNREEYAAHADSLADHYGVQCVLLGAT